MSYKVFNEEFLQELDTFGDGLHQHISIIKYEVLTPDLFMLCFRTNGKDGQEHYFAFLKYDYMHTTKYARMTINKNFAKVIEFMPPLEKQKGRTQLDQKSAYDTNHCMRFLLARTERPIGKGYWASYITILPGDDIAHKLSGLPKDDEAMARKTLVEILNNQTASNAEKKPNDFMSEWQQKFERMKMKPEELNINDTNLGINLFKNASGAWEAFYNYLKK